MPFCELMDLRITLKVNTLCGETPHPTKFALFAPLVLNGAATRRTS